MASKKHPLQENYERLFNSRLVASQIKESGPDYFDRDPDMVRFEDESIEILYGNLRVGIAKILEDSKMEIAEMGRTYSHNPDDSSGMSLWKYALENAKSERWVRTLLGEILQKTR